MFYKNNKNIFFQQLFGRYIIFIDIIFSLYISHKKLYIVCEHDLHYNKIYENLFLNFMNRSTKYLV